MVWLKVDWWRCAAAVDVARAGWRGATDRWSHPTRAPAEGWEVWCALGCTVGDGGGRHSRASLHGGTVWCLSMFSRCSRRPRGVEAPRWWRRSALGQLAQSLAPRLLRGCGLARALPAYGLGEVMVCRRSRAGHGGHVGWLIVGNSVLCVASGLARRRSRVLRGGQGAWLIVGGFVGCLSSRPWRSGAWRATVAAGFGACRCSRVARGGHVVWLKVGGWTGVQCWR